MHAASSGGRVGYSSVQKHPRPLILAVAPAALPDPPGRGVRAGDGHLQDPALGDLSQGKHLHPVSRVGGGWKRKKVGRTSQFWVEAARLLFLSLFVAGLGPFPGVDRS